MYFTYKLIILYEKDNTYDIKWVKSETNWLKNLIYLGVLACICWIFAVAKTTIYDLNDIQLFYPLWIGISILIYLIGYAGLNKSKELRNRIELREKRIEHLKVKQNRPNRNSESFDRIKDYIQEEKSYLNPNLSLKYLSNKFNLSEGYISQLINKNLSINFSDYINSLRVEEAKKMLADSEYERYTVLSIGLESGFNSKSSFYTIFKKVTGQTPLEHKKSVQYIKQY
jgi:AraC-like DNA-binding protein